MQQKCNAKMVVYRFSLLAFVVAVGFGCATAQSLPVDQRSRTYEVTQDAGITAFVDAVTAEGYTVEMIDRESGLVKTSPKSSGAMQTALAGKTSRQIQARVRDTSEGARVTLTFVWEKQNAYGQSSSMPIGQDAAKKMYQKWLSGSRSR
jgi:hypothetical protein